MKIKEIKEELNLMGCMHNFKQVAFSAFLNFNGFIILDEDYEDFEYEDPKAYLELEVERI